MAEDLPKPYSNVPEPQTLPEGKSTILHARENLRAALDSLGIFIKRTRGNPVSPTAEVTKNSDSPVDKV